MEIAWLRQQDLSEAEAHAERVLWGICGGRAGRRGDPWAIVKRQLCRRCAMSAVAIDCESRLGR